MSSPRRKRPVAVINASIAKMHVEAIFAQFAARPGNAWRTLMTEQGPVSGDEWLPLAGLGGFKWHRTDILAAGVAES